ncbi:hypothetical protein BJX68DRAFT_229921 [Aspergillus pseudodeflectus]|uniref:Urease accessory protein UreD n=1 Tax=Aspergillus pseudodeflectus TaxID=176178 RepID=A0ABR4KYX1_9EURO
MPHKHKRRQNDPNTYDLPPNLIAKALPVRDPSKPGKPKGKGKGNFKPVTKAITKQNPNAGSRRKTERDDDTPAAFRRLMQYQERSQMKKANKKRKRDGDDDSDDDSESDAPVPVPKKGTKAKKTPAGVSTSTSTGAETETDKQEKSVVAPKILPGEKLSDFAARVDREMPLSNMKRSANPSTPGDLPKMKDHRTTKHEKHLRRLQAQWREDDVRIKEKEAAEREEREEEMEEQLRLWKEWEAESGKKKRNPNAAAGKQKKKGTGAEGVEHDDGPDPWAKLKKKRAAVNPFDVAQEPPQLKKPREIFKVRGGAKVDVANVPASVGSLRRREELANERRNIVEEYRRLMAEKRKA